MTKSYQLKLGALLSYTGIFFSFITGLIYTPWMINTIGDADYGIYTLAISLINTFIFDFGISMAVQRYVSKYIAEQKQDMADNIIGLIMKLYSVIALVMATVFIILYFFIDKIYIQLTYDELEKFKVLFLIAALNSIISTLFIPVTGILRSYEKFIQVKLGDLIYKLLSVGFTVIALILGTGVYALVIVHLFANIVLVICKVFFLKRYTIVKPNLKYTDFKLLREVFDFSIWNSVSTIVMRLLLSLAPSILGVVSGSIEMAIFGYAVSLEGFVYSFVNAINGFFMPRLSRISLDDTGEAPDRVLQLMISVGRFILMLFGLILIGFIALGKDLIMLLVGENYLNSYFCMMLICGYGIVAYPQQIANTYVIVMNKVKKKAIISLGIMAVYIFLAFLLGKLFGAIGVSIGICVALCIQTLFLNILYYRDLKINVFKFFKECHLKMIPGFLTYGLFAYLVTKIQIEGWSGFFVKVAILIVSYIMIALLMFLSQDEKKQLVIMINSKKRG